MIFFHDSQDVHFGLSIARSIIHLAGINFRYLDIFFDRSNGPIRSSEVFRRIFEESEASNEVLQSMQTDSKDRNTVKLIVILIVL